MSSCYGLFHVINELLDEKANKNSTARGKTIGAKSEIYQGSWSALNAWIETKLAKQKGAGISGFGCFCWELKRKDTVAHCRPIFIISDAFVKNFRVKRERIHRLPETTAIEEINYSALAIKFSNSLTKDMVFSGLRDIIKKIGDYIDRGYELEINFTCGKLRAKERRVRFEFDQSRLREILPDRIAPGTLGFGSAPPHLFEETPSEAGEELTYRGSEVDSAEGASRNNPPPATNVGDTARRIETSAPDTTTASSSSVPKVPSLLMQTSNFGVASIDEVGREIEDPSPFAVQKSKPDIPMLSFEIAAVTQGGPPADGSESPEQELEVPEDLQDLLNTLADKDKKASKEVFRNQAKERVLEQAYIRSLNSIEDGAHKDDNTTLEAKQLLEDWRHSTQQKRDEKAQHMMELRSSLDGQIDRNLKQEAQRKEDKKNTIMRFILPENAGQGRSVTLKEQLDADGNVVISKQHAISNILADQIERNIHEKIQKRKDTLAVERDYLRRLKTEIDYHNAVSRTSHLEKQRSLLESWERDGHIRNLKKLQPFGVKPVQDYIDRNLNADPFATTTGPLNYSSTVPSLGSGQETFATTLMNTKSAGPAPDGLMEGGSTLAGKLNKSIGYDPRRGKVEW